MRRACSWCAKGLKGKPGQSRVTSHGICVTCLMRFFGYEEVNVGLVEKLVTARKEYDVPVKKRGKR